MTKLSRWYAKLMYFFAERRFQVIYRIDHFWRDDDELFLRYRVVGNRPLMQSNIRDFIAEDRYMHLSDVDRIRFAKCTVLQSMLNRLKEKEGKTPEWVFHFLQEQLENINEGASL